MYCSVKISLLLLAKKSVFAVEHSMRSSVSHALLTCNISSSSPQTKNVSHVKFKTVMEEVNRNNGEYEI